MLGVSTVYSLWWEFYCVVTSYTYNMWLYIIWFLKNLFVFCVVFVD
jgi:hypothetical protein